MNDTLSFPVDLEMQLRELDLGIDDLEALEAPGWKSFWGGVAFGVVAGGAVVFFAT